MKLKDRFLNIWYGYPLAIGSLFLMILSFVLLFAATAIKILLICFAILLSPFLIILAVKSKEKDKRKLIIPLVAFLILPAISSFSCFLSYDLYDKSISEMAVAEKTVTIQGYPTQTVYSEDFSSLYIFKVTKLNGNKVYSVEILVETADAFPRLYEIYQGSVSLKTPMGTDPSFDGYDYYRKQGIHAVALCGEDFHDTGRLAKTPNLLFHQIRVAVGNVIDDNTKIDSPERGLLRALLIADSSKIPDDVDRNFKTLGLSHILAVSGMHLSILFSVFDWILLRFKLNRKPRLAILAVFVLFYMGLCGFTLSVVRAGIMLYIYMISAFVDEQSESVPSLLFSGGVICLFSPYSIFDCGFLLSFFATLGLLTVGSHLAGKMRMKMKWYERAFQYIRASIAVSLGAQLAVLPIVYDIFGYVSILSPVFTLILSPFFTLMLYIAPFALILSFYPHFSQILFIPLKHLCRIADQIADLAVYVEDFTVSIDRGFTVLFVVIIVLLFILLAFTDRKKTVSIIMISAYLVLCCISLACPYFTKPVATFAVNKDNDILYLSDAGGESCIIDLSNGSLSNQALSAYHLLESHHDRNPEALVLTHYHQRHIATLNAMCMNYYIDTLYLPEPTEKDAEICESILSVAENHQLHVIFYNEDSVLTLCGYSFFGYDRQYLDRSGHPVFTFCLQRERESVRYFSASYPEIANYSMYQERIYFGTHGPIVTEDLNELLVKDNSVFASETLYNNYSCRKRYKKEKLRYFSFE